MKTQIHSKGFEPQTMQAKNRTSRQVSINKALQQYGERDMQRLDVKEELEKKKSDQKFKIKPSLNLIKSNGSSPKFGQNQFHDAILPTIALQKTIATPTPRGLPLNAFGVSEFTYSTRDTVCVPIAGRNEFQLTTTLQVDASWEVGDGGRTDVLSQDSAAVSKDTWFDIYKDLYPNRLGKPSRINYWNSALVERHEKLHIRDGSNAIERKMGEITTWLGQQTIDPVKNISTQVNLLTQGLVTEARRYCNEDYGANIQNHDDRPGEIRAYGDGRALYRSLTQRIRAKARKQNWGGEDTQWHKAD